MADHRHTILFVVENPTAGIHWVVVVIFSLSCFIYSVNRIRLPILIFLVAYCIMVGIVFYSNRSLAKPFQGYYRVQTKSFQTLYNQLIIEPRIIKMLELDKPAQ